MNSEFIEALRDLEKEKGINIDVLLETIEAALISAYKKHFGSSQNVRVEINRLDGDIHVYFRKDVVEVVEDERTQMSLAEARQYDPDFEAGDMFESEVTPRSFGRIAAQTAKHVVVQRLREAERNLVYDQFATRKDDIISATVLRQEGKNIYIDLGKTEALLAPSEQIMRESYHSGDRIKVYVLEVRRTTKGPQIIVSRTHPGLLKRLLEKEVPEIYDGTVEIKAVVREPGWRAKIAVTSHNDNVDPVGACVGSKGMRVQSIVNELSGEKIEIVRWDEDMAVFISNALSPAKVISVSIDEDEKFSQVVVPDHQLSLAIGKEGQNARLAARLTAWKIDIKSESQMAALLEAEDEQELLEEEMLEDVYLAAGAARGEGPEDLIEDDIIDAIVDDAIADDTVDNAAEAAEAAEATAKKKPKKAKKQETPADSAEAAAEAAVNEGEATEAAEATAKKKPKKAKKQETPADSAEAAVIDEGEATEAAEATAKKKPKKAKKQDTPAESGEDIAENAG